MRYYQQAIELLFSPSPDKRDFVDAGRFAKRIWISLLYYSAQSPTEYRAGTCENCDCNRNLESQNQRLKNMLNSTASAKILKYCQAKGYLLADFNIIYIEGIDIDGRLNNDAPNQFNDIRAIFDRQKCIDCWQATCEPGFWYTDYPMNAAGAFRIAFGCYQKAWEIGIHGNSDPHESLIQVGEVRGWRDFNKDMVRTGDRLVSGYFGINQHWGYDMPPGDIGEASAGCLVGRSRHGHSEFIKLCRDSGRRYFDTIVVPGNEIFKG